MSLAAAVFAAAEKTPARDALICGGRRVSYAELRGLVRGASSFLAGRGVVRGDRVLLEARSDGPSFVAAYLACHALGAIAVPYDRALPATALEGLSRLTRAKLAVSGAGELDGGAAACAPVENGPEEPADILFTGGTTGAPKGVVLTHGNIRAFLEGRAWAVGASAQERLVLPLPLSHGFGLSRLRAVLATGACAILVDGFLAPGDIYRALDEFGGNALCCVPYGFAVLFELSGDELGAYRGRLRTIETATAPLPAEHRDRLLKLLPGTRLFNSYGMTETCSSIAYAELSTAAGKAGSVGRAVPGVEITAGGRVRVRGACVMAGYWESPGQTAAVLEGGWYAANDLGRLDDDGYLYLTGRPEELINVGGLKVAPAEVEGVLRTHAAVADCACVATPDELTGERVRAVLVAAPGAARPSDRELGEWLRARLESYKLPARYDWRDSLPRTALGKLDRSALKERAGDA